MQTKHNAAHGAPRTPPKGMPTRVPPRRPPKAPPARDQLPTQQPVTDEPVARPPARWKAMLKRVLAILGLILSLALVYVFLLIGEPEEDTQLSQQTQAQEEIIRVPIAATQMDGTADLNALAVNFGMPVLTLQGAPVTLQKASLFDTAFRGGYARRFQLTYAYPTGETMLVESIRPTAAVSLVARGSYSLNVAQLYTLGGMDAVRMDSGDAVLLMARGLDAAYAVTLPKAYADTLATLLKQCVLMQPTAP